MIRIHVSNMSCGGCAKGVTRAVLDVVKSAKIDIDLGTRIVTISGAASETEIVQALERAGYQAHLLVARAA